MTAKSLHLRLAIACLIALSAAPPLAGVRAEDNGKPQAGAGRYSNLTADWWEWVFAQPAVDVNGTNTNPVLDSTGQFARAGQANGTGPGNRYFFLAGSFGG